MNLEERERLLTHATDLVGGETFSNQFADFVGTMRQMVGLVRPDGPSNALPYSSGYARCLLEFNEPSIDVVQRFVQRERYADYIRRTMHLRHSPDLPGFTLQMPFPEPSHIYFLDQLFHLPDQITFSTETRPESRGKGSIRWAMLPLPESTVQGFCRNILQQLQELPPDYIFEDGEIIDKRSRVDKGGKFHLS